MATTPRRSTRLSLNTSNDKAAVTAASKRKTPIVDESDEEEVDNNDLDADYEASDDDYAEGDGELDGEDVEDGEEEGKMKVYKGEGDDSMRYDLPPHVRSPGNYKLCPMCGLYISRSVGLQKHILRDHEGQPPSILCAHCDMKFYSDRDLKEHCRYSHAPRIYKCDQCEKSFTTHTTYRYHMNGHNNNCEFSCFECDAKFPSPAQRNAHRVTIHQEETPFVCGVCDKGFKRLAALNRHQYSHTDEKTLECEECGKMLKTPYHLSRHLRFVHGERPRNFFCDYCPKGFQYKQELEKHIRTHTNERPYVCDCGSSFKADAAFRAHQRTHLPENTLRCRHCERAFASHSARIYHEKLVHLQDAEKFKCEEEDCDAEFNTRAHLKNHVIQVHTKEFPHLCPKCDKGFLAPVVLRKHMEAKHGVVLSPEDVKRRRSSGPEKTSTPMQAVSYASTHKSRGRPAKKSTTPSTGNDKSPEIAKLKMLAIRMGSKKRGRKSKKGSEYDFNDDEDDDVADADYTAGSGAAKWRRGSGKKSVGAGKETNGDDQVEVKRTLRTRVSESKPLVVNGDVNNNDDDVVVDTNNNNTPKRNKRKTFNGKDSNNNVVEKKVSPKRIRPKSMC